MPPYLTYSELSDVVARTLLRSRQATVKTEPKVTQNEIEDVNHHVVNKLDKVSLLIALV